MHAGGIYQSDAPRPGAPPRHDEGWAAQGSPGQQGPLETPRGQQIAC